LIVGSLRRQSFAEIWESALFGVFSDRRDRRDHCAVCTDRAYCGGCRARAIAYFDDIRAGDPGCVRNEFLWDQLAAPGQSLVSIGNGAAP
jgi:radical SAM protein with 4Fe4S-binding SPASM domain